MCRMLLGALVSAFLVTSVAAQYGADEDAIRDVVERFRVAAGGDSQPEELRPLLAGDYVHITPDGRMTTSWRLLRSTQKQSLAIEKLHIQVLGDVGIAAYVWRGQTTQQASVMQVLQKRGRQWWLIASQVGGANPFVEGPISSADIIAPRNQELEEDQVLRTWSRYMDAVNLRTSAGERAEDIDVIRGIFAEDATYLDANGRASTREERLALGHGIALRLTGEQRVGAVVVRGAYVPDHIDVRVAVFGNAAVWTSRNPANLDQSLRVWLKRPAGWQMVAMHHGMSFVTR